MGKHCLPYKCGGDWSLLQRFMESGHSSEWRFRFLRFVKVAIALLVPLVIASIPNRLRHRRT